MPTQETAYAEADGSAQTLRINSQNDQELIPPACDAEIVSPQRIASIKRLRYPNGRLRLIYR